MAIGRSYCLVTAVLAGMCGSVSWAGPNEPGDVSAAMEVESQAAQGSLGMATLSARVAADGTLVAGSGAKSVSRSGSDYIVVFTRNVRSCIYIATLGNPDAAGIPAPGVISATGAAIDVKGVYIDIKDLTGTDVDRPFNLLVTSNK